MSSLLIIEDDANLRMILRNIIEQAGHRVCVATDGKDALTKIQEDPPDLVITDIIMPEKEGIEVILCLRKNYPDIRIIAMSGGGQLGADHYLDMAHEFGAHITIPKPFDKQIILDAINQLLTPLKSQ